MTLIQRTHGEHYLESSVLTASPAKLKLMLIERGVEVATRLAGSWRSGKPGTDGVNEHSITLLEILNELLSGVTGTDSTLGDQVADLYVFLCKHLVEALSTSDASAVDEIRLVLETEAETWRMVCAQETGSTHPAPPQVSPVDGGLDVQG